MRFTKWKMFSGVIMVDGVEVATCQLNDTQGFFWTLR